MADADNAAGITIDSSGQHNNSKVLDGLPAATATGQATRWDEAITKDGAKAFTANQPMGTHKLTGLLAGSATGDSVSYEQVQDVGKLSLLVDVIVDDFDTGGSANTGAPLIVNGATFGRAGWRVGYSGSGSAGVTLVSTGQDSTHFGVVSLDAGTTTSGVSAICRGSAGTLTHVTWGTGQAFTQDWLIQIPTLSDGTNTYTLQIGWPNLTTAATDGIYFEYSSTLSSGNWRGVSRASSVTTLASGGSTVAAASGTWIHLQITWDGTTWTFYVNGTSIGTTTAAQSIAGFPCASITKSAGGSNRNLLIDLYQEKRSWTSARAT